MKKTEVPVCKEMKKLRKWLDDNKIPWLDASEGSKLGGAGIMVDVSHSF